MGTEPGAWNPCLIEGQYPIHMHVYDGNVHLGPCSTLPRTQKGKTLSLMLPYDLHPVHETVSGVFIHLLCIIWPDALAGYAYSMHGC